MCCRIWNVTGGVDGLTCNAADQTDSGSMACKTLNIPDCVDRTVYCTFPPKVSHPTTIDILENPSPYYNKDGK